MNDFPRIRHILSAAFDVSVGLSDDAAKQLLLRQMSVRDWREAFERELRRAFGDPATPWRELLFNGLYEVCEFDTDAEARSHAARLLWAVAFPTEPLPNAPET